MIYFCNLKCHFHFHCIYNYYKITHFSYSLKFFEGNVFQVNETILTINSRSYILLNIYLRTSILYASYI